MVSKFALGNILLASAALAAPSSQQGALLAHQPHLVNSHGIALSSRAPNVDGNPNWAGVVVTLNDQGALTTVSGTFAVPTLSGGGDGNGYSGFSTWIGLDGYECPDGFRAGIEGIFIDGVVTYSAWYGFTSTSARARAHIPESINLSANDVFTVMITVAFGDIDYYTVIIENQTTGQTVNLQTASVLGGVFVCGQEAQWVTGVVDDYNNIPLANFSAVGFTDATATGPIASVNPLDATTILDVMQKNQAGDEIFLTFVNIAEDGLIVQYI